MNVCIVSSAHLFGGGGQESHFNVVTPLLVACSRGCSDNSFSPTLCSLHRVQRTVPKLRCPVRTGNSFTVMYTYAEPRQKPSL